jgi:hypothetical protein
MKPVRIHSLTADEIEVELFGSMEQTGMPDTPEVMQGEPVIGINMPVRGSGPVRIDKLLEPIGKIIHHPDRDRLMAELFKDCR